MTTPLLKNAHALRPMDAARRFGDRRSRRRTGAGHGGRHCRVGYAPAQLPGSRADPVAALLFCPPMNVSYAFIHGRRVGDRGQLTVLDLPVIAERHNTLSCALLDGTL